MKKKRVVGYILLISLIGFIAVVLNFFMGNPIKKIITQKRCLQYYESRYGEKFIIYGSNYSFLYPGYNLEIGPENNKNIKFDVMWSTDKHTGNKNYPEITDVYGGILACEKLTESISSILKPNYAFLNFSITAEEDPHSFPADQHPSYFETDPGVRIQNNTINIKITWIDNGLNESEIKKLSLEMKKLIESKLQYKPKYASVEINVTSANNEKVVFIAHMPLFSTIVEEDIINLRNKLQYAK
jgi:hypothetical protein